MYHNSGSQDRPGHGTAAHAAPAAPAAAARRSGARAGNGAWTLPGFCWNTRVTTSFGAVPVQALREHDPVRTQSGAYMRVKRVDRISLDEGYLAHCPDAQPVIIRAGALGDGRPMADLVISPAQHVNLSDTPARLDLCPARDLTGRPNVFRRAEPEVSYFTFHVGAPAVLIIDGLGVPVTPL